jgi:hypothetical protein
MIGTNPAMLVLMRDACVDAEQMAGQDIGASGSLFCPEHHALSCVNRHFEEKTF